MVFFFNDTSTTEIYTLSLHDALPICRRQLFERKFPVDHRLYRTAFDQGGDVPELVAVGFGDRPFVSRSEEHTSELKSPDHLLCRLLLEKKKNFTCYS